MPDITNYDGLSIEGIPFFTGHYGDRYVNYQITALKYTAQVSEFYEMTLNLSTNLSLDDGKFEQLFDSCVTIIVKYQGQKKYYKGIVTSAKKHQGVTNDKNTHLTLQIGPYLNVLQFQNGYRTFSDKSSCDVIEFLMEKLKKQFPNFEYFIDMNRNTNVKKMNIVQYGDSDYDFLLRMCYEGLYCFYFIHSEKKLKIIFTDDLEFAFKHDRKHDDASKSPEILLDVSTQERAPTHYNATGYKKEYNREFPQTVRALDYDFRAFPAMMEIVDHEKPSGPVWYHHENLLSKSHESLQHINSDEAQYQNKKFNEIQKSKTNCVSFMTSNENVRMGSEITLDMSHVTPSWEKQIVVVYGVMETYDVAGSALRHVNAFVSKSEFHPAIERVDKKRIHGTTTGVVAGKMDGPPNLHDMMLIEVHFPWQVPEYSDTEKNKWQSKSIFVRLGQTSAGLDHGSVMIPRAGAEAVLAFDHGDPEKGAIIGYVYNNRNTAPHPKKLPDLNTTIFRTNPGENKKDKPNNQVIINDNKGKELIAATASGDFHLKAEKNLSLHSKDSHVSMTNEAIKLGAKSSMHMETKAIQLNANTISLENDKAELFDVLAKMCQQLSMATTTTAIGAQPLVNASMFKQFEGLLRSFIGGATASAAELPPSSTSSGGQSAGAGGNAGSGAGGGSSAGGSAANSNTNNSATAVPGAGSNQANSATDNLVILEPSNNSIFTVPSNARWPNIIFKTNKVGMHKWDWHIEWITKNDKVKDKQKFEKSGSDYTPEETWYAKSAIENLGGKLTVTATYEDQSATVTIYIQGANPSRDEIREYLNGKENWEWLYQCIGQESHYLHYSPPDEPYTSFDKGYGLCQLTTTSPTYEQVWNWKLNLDGGIKHLKALKKEAEHYLSTKCKTDEINTGNYTADQLQRETYSRWNGGVYYVWDYDKKTYKRKNFYCVPTSNRGWNMDSEVNSGKSPNQLDPSNSKFVGVCYADHLLGPL